MKYRSKSIFVLYIIHICSRMYSLLVNESYSVVILVILVLLTVLEFSSTFPLYSAYVSFQYIIYYSGKNTGSKALLKIDIELF